MTKFNVTDYITFTPPIIKKNNGEVMDRSEQILHPDDQQAIIDELQSYANKSKAVQALIKQAAENSGTGKVHFLFDGSRFGPHAPREFASGGANTVKIGNALSTVQYKPKGADEYVNVSFGRILLHEIGHHALKEYSPFGGELQVVKNNDAILKNNPFNEPERAVTIAKGRDMIDQEFKGTRGWDRAGKEPHIFKAPIAKDGVSR